MKNKKQLKLFVFYFVVVAFVPMSGCKALMAFLNSAFQKPTLTYKTMHLRDVSFKGMNMDFEFALNNPNSVGVTLTKLAFQLDLDGNTLFKGVSQKSIEIQANGTSPVRLPFGVEFIKFARSLMTLFSSRDSVPYKISVTFGIDTPIGEVVLPFSKSDSVPLPKIPDISLGKVDVKVVKTMKSIPLLGSFAIPTGAVINLALNLKQKGKFPVQLRGLNYDVKMGGTSLFKSSTKPGNMSVGGSQVVNIPIRLGQQQAITLFKSIVAKKFDMRLDGALDLGAFKLPLNFDANKSKGLKLPELGSLSTLLGALSKFKIPGM